MKDFLWNFGPAILGIVSAIIGGGIGGLIPMAIAGVAAAVGAILVQRAYQSYKYNKAHKKLNDEAAIDHAQSTKQNQQQAIADKQALKDSESAHDKAFKSE